LIEGISTEQVAKRGADHTTNGIRMGIDGWIYIAVGDFGFVNAKGADGTTLTKRGGGVVRVRPDGTEMEVYSWGQRNILDLALDPYLNGFTRDNTNDGGGWDVRLSHVMQSADYGYPSKFLNFTDEIMPPLADYGGGSGCGSLYLHDPRWWGPFGNALYTCDWGRSEVYRHELTPSGPTFTATAQHTFLKIPRPTDIDIDGSGRMYVSSWKGGQFNYAGPNIGFVAQVVPQDFLPKPFPDLAALGDAALVKELAHPSAVHRLHAQRELLRRGRGTERTRGLVALASDPSQPLYGRVAAAFTLKQLDGAEATAALVKLTEDAALRESALRALADRKAQLDDVPVEPFLAGLKDEDPRVVAQAIIGLGRLGRTDVAADLVPLTVRQDAPKSPQHAQPDPGRVIPHLAVQALVELNAAEACLAALDGPYSSGALWALRLLHEPAAVDGLIAKLNRTSDPARRGELLGVLIRLYHREGDYQGDWWGTRPDTSGPYYDRQKWAASDRIAGVLRTAVREAEPAAAKKRLAELSRHKVAIDGLPKPDDVAANPADEPQTPIEVPKVDSEDPNLIANQTYEAAAGRALKAQGDAERGRLLFERQSCVACHTTAEGQRPKGPHLVDIGQRYKREELIESILRPSAKIAQGFDTFGFITADGKILTGFVVSESATDVTVREANGLSHTLKLDDIEERAKKEISMMPDGIAGNLTPEELADLLAYLESLK
jgi:putative heme-binding domain-containing protein